MKRQTIWIITSAMSIALVGLISFQVYWINNTIKLNQESFDRDIYESLNQVINQLERQEVFSYTHKAIDILHPIKSPINPIAPPAEVSYKKVRTPRGVRVIYPSRGDTVYEDMKLQIETEYHEASKDTIDNELLSVKHLGDTIYYEHGEDVIVKEDKIKKKFKIFDEVIEGINQMEKSSIRTINLTKLIL